MTDRAVLQSRTKALVCEFSRVALCLAILLSLNLSACVNYEKQGSASPLAAAERRLALAERHGSNVEGQAAEYLSVAKIAEEQLPSGPNADPAKSSAVKLYNRATADLAAHLPPLIQQERNSRTLSLKDSQTGQIDQLQLEQGGKGEFSPTYFQQILTAERVDKKGMKDDAIRTGLGGEVVGVHHSSSLDTSPARLEPRKGVRAPVTVILDVDRSGQEHLRLLDPTKMDDVVLDKKRYALAGDFTAANASYGRINEIWIGLLNMVRGERMVGTAGLLLLQPYDPEKIPVIFVHGLLSSAYVWRNTANSLSVDPEIRRRYQFWVFSYSTGNPIAYSALLFRRDLAYAEQTYHFKKTILIGHSMGGLLSRLQVTNTGRVLWDGVFGPRADTLYASQPQDSLIKQALIFSANPTVERVVFVATPHRGSSLSTGGIGALGMSLIRLPFKVVSAIPQSVIAAVAPNNDPRKFRPPNSISGLSPQNPMLLALDKLPIEAPHNSIIGDRGRGDTPKSSDGVVPYWSSHLDTAQSELIVPTDHGAMNHPKAVQEMRRILLEEPGKGNAQKSAKKTQRGVAKAQRNRSGGRRSPLQPKNP
jgi:pimeloyl-ACP methyl ester carboxylesterase